MKILIITHAAGTPEIGPNMRTFYLARHLTMKGFEVEIMGSGNFHKYKKSPLENKKYTTKTIEGIRYHWLPTYDYKKRNYQQVLNQLSFVWELFKMKSYVMKYNPDIILMSSPPPFAIYFGSQIAKRCKAKLIFEIRDLWPEIIKELGGFKSFHPYIKLVEHTIKYAYKKADGIVSVKPGDLRYIEENYIIKGKTKFIPNGFDHTLIYDEHFVHECFNNNKFKIIYTGALSNYYAIEYLLYAAEELKESYPKISFIIVGDGEDKSKYERIKKDRNLTNVTFLGFLPKKNMLSVIRQADVAYLGLRNTKANEFGISTNKLYEYMYAKKPILASYNTKFDLVKEAGNGLSIEPENIDALVEAIKEVYLLSAEKRGEMGEKGFNYLLERHTFEKISEEYTKFFELI